jgi:hypothetical protein
VYIKKKEEKATGKKATNPLAKDVLDSVGLFSVELHLAPFHPQICPSWLRIVLRTSAQSQDQPTRKKPLPRSPAQCSIFLKARFDQGLLRTEFYDCSRIQSPESEITA